MKNERRGMAATLAGIMGLCAVLARCAPLSAAVVTADPVDIALEKSEDGTRYEAAYEFNTNDWVPAGKKLVLFEDSVNKMGDADLSVSFSKETFERDNTAGQITFTSTGFSQGDYSATKTITGKTYSDPDYTAREIPLLEDFEWEPDKQDGSVIILTKYIGSETDVVVYPRYRLFADRSDSYQAKIAYTKYAASIDESKYNPDGEYEGSDRHEEIEEKAVFAGNKQITSVTFLDGVKIQKPMNQNTVIQSDNIYDVDTYYDYHYSWEQIQGALDEGSYIDVDGRPTATGYYGPDMKGMFAGCTSLVAVCNIPDDVVKMTNTFRGCTSLTTVTNLPSALRDMEKTFMDCENLVEVPQIPENVVNMLATFRDCKKLNPRVPLYIPETVTNLMETFENCHAMEKTPIISPRMKVRNLFYTFYRCKKMEQLPVLPESAVSMFRTFYGCESATSTVNGTPHVIGNNGKDDLPLNLIDSYRGCKRLNADIYIDMDKGIKGNQYINDGMGYRITYQNGGIEQNAQASYSALFSDDTWLYNCYDYRKLWEKQKEEAIGRMLPAGTTLLTTEENQEVEEKRYIYEYRQQAPKGIFWEAALAEDAQIRLHLTDNAGFDTNVFNFTNGGSSILGAPGAVGATGTTMMDIDRYDALPMLTGDARQREEAPVPVKYDNDKVVYTFNLHYRISENEERLDSIMITTPPDKTEYVEGERFDRTGMVVKAFYRLYVDDVPTDTVGEGIVVTEYTTDKDILQLEDTKSS